ncbi:type II toxin-antitoxin system PemK/MazF family toxin [Desertimonas flava]|uniref:type II toxin-antitoxin system PemK/MazF family toxin n=1 Tax=Desertimonas flava TaxID=2064846 RepID=UPI000E347895|nr:type II toxin-antitoxin system PemK/MazF family toxin [Desertimonas flava]
MAGLIAKLSRAVRRATATVSNRERNTGRVERRERPTARPVESGIRIAYSPQLDGDPDPGEVVWTWVPFEDDPTLGKDRPVVIIGRRGDDLSGVALTSKGKARDDYVEVGTGDWDGRHRPSYAKVDRLLDVDPGEVRREGAILNRRQFDDVIEAVRRLHDVAR